MLHSATSQGFIQIVATVKGGQMNLPKICRRMTFCLGLVLALSVFSQGQCQNQTCTFKQSIRPSQPGCWGCVGLTGSECQTSGGSCPQNCTVTLCPASPLAGNTRGTAATAASLFTPACDPAIEFNCPGQRAGEGQPLPVLALRLTLLPDEMIAAVNPPQTYTAPQCQAAPLPKNLLFDL